MSYDDDRQSAYLCAVPQEKSLGWLQRGIRTSKVRLVEMSRDAFVLAAPQELTNRIRQGGLYRLKYDDELWEVRCDSITQLEDGTARISMCREHDLTKMEIQSLKLHGGEISVSVRQSDPLLPAGVLMAIVITVLITPGWGDELGTSTILTDAISSVMVAVREVFANIGSR